MVASWSGQQRRWHGSGSTKRRPRQREPRRAVLSSRHCCHIHRLSNPHSGPPWKFPCLVGRHYHSTEIPHLHLQRLVRRTSAQIESNLFPCHFVLLDLYMSATNFTIAHLHPCLCHPQGGLSKGGNGKINHATLPRFICFATTSVQATEHSAFFSSVSLSFHTDEAGALRGARPSYL